MAKYRINGFDQIKAFYSLVFSQTHPIKPQHASLYVFLINQNNRNNWVEWFKCPYDLAMAGACISSKKTYYRCLNDLQDFGLIKYEKGINEWKAPMISIEVLKDTSSVPQGEPLVEQLVEPLVEQLGTHIYKLYNLKQLNLLTREDIKVKEFLNSLTQPDPLETNFTNYTKHFFQQSTLDRLGMKTNIKPNEIKLVATEFFDKCYGDIMEKRNKFQVEQYFMNWVKIEGRVKEALSNQFKKHKL